MKIGYKPVYYFKLKSWFDKYVDISRIPLTTTPTPSFVRRGNASLHGHTLQSPCRCCTNRNHPSTFLFSSANLFGDSIADLHPLGMHNMIFNYLGFDRTKCSHSNMQGYVFNPHSHVFYLFQKLDCKMKSS